MGQNLFHFNLTVVLSGHMTILLKFYLWHQKWPKLAPNSPTKWPEITWTSGISIPVRILPLLRSFLVVISLLQFYLWDRKWPKWLQNDQKWAGAVFDQKSGKLSVFRSYNPKFHNLEPKRPIFSLGMYLLYRQLWCSPTGNWWTTLVGLKTSRSNRLHSSGEVPIIINQQFSILQKMCLSHFSINFTFTL